MSDNTLARFNSNGIPNYLKNRPQWVVWGKRVTQFQDVLQDGKLNKVPFSPRTGHAAKSNQSDTWGTFADAVRAYQTGWYNGIGFMFAEGDGLVGIDTDHCLNPETKALSLKAQDIVSHFDATFIEISPSGDGLHIYCFGLALHCGKGEREKWIELYGKDIAGHRSNRYFCVTGNQFSQTLEITDCQASLAWLHNTYKTEPTPAAPAAIPITTPSTQTRDSSTAPTTTRPEKYIRMAFDDEISKVQNASEGSRNDQLFRSAAALKEICNSFWAAPFLTEQEIEFALLNATTLPHKEAQRTIASAFKTATGTREEPKSTIAIQNVIAQLSSSKAPKQTLPPSSEFFYVDQKGNSRLLGQSLARDMLIRAITNIAFNAFTEDWYQYQDGVWRCIPKNQILHEIDTIISASCSKVEISYSANWLNGVFKLSQYALSRNDWDEQPRNLIPFKNGVLNLSDSKLLPHNPEDRFTWQLPYDYDPNATCQPIINFLSECVNGDENQVQVLRAFLHATITGRYDLERYIELIGKGGSGKSTFSWLCQSLIGAENLRASDFKALESNRFESASLYGKRLLLLTDESKFAGDVANFKKITGGDPLRYEDKHKSVRGDKSRDFIFKGMALVIANQAIRSSDYTSGLQRRRLTIYFNNKPSKAKRLKGENGELFPHLSGLVNWILAMPVKDVEYYLIDGDKVINSLVTTRLDNLEQTNPLFAWLQENVIYDENGFTPIGKKTEITITTGEMDSPNKQSRREFVNQGSYLYPNYCQFCLAIGRNPVSNNDFSKLLEDLCQSQLGLEKVERGFKRVNGKNTKGFRCLTLNSQQTCKFIESTPGNTWQHPGNTPGNTKTLERVCGNTGNTKLQGKLLSTNEVNGDDDYKNISKKVLPVLPVEQPLDYIDNQVLPKSCQGVAMASQGVATVMGDKIFVSPNGHQGSVKKVPLNEIITESDGAFLAKAIDRHCKTNGYIDDHKACQIHNDYRTLYLESPAAANQWLSTLTGEPYPSSQPDEIKDDDSKDSVELHPKDRHFWAERIKRVPYNNRPAIEKQYKTMYQEQGAFTANTWLREQTGG